MPRVGRDSGSPDPDFNFLEHSITQHQELGEEVLITGTSAGGWTKLIIYSWKTNREKGLYVTKAESTKVTV